MKLRFLGFKVKEVINPEKMTLYRVMLSQYGGTKVNWRHDMITLLRLGLTAVTVVSCTMRDWQR